MPKEVICKPPAHPNDPGEPYCVHVGWMADGDHVSIGTVGRDDRSLFWLLFGQDDAALERLGTLLLEVVRDHERPDRQTGGTIELARDVLNRLDVDYGNYDGVYANFDNRRQVNDLVQALRRARDAAFGKDA